MNYAARRTKVDKSISRDIKGTSLNAKLNGHGDYSTLDRRKLS